MTRIIVGPVHTQDETVSPCSAQAGPYRADDDDDDDDGIGMFALANEYLAQFISHQSAINMFEKTRPLATLTHTHTL